MFYEFHTERQQFSTFQPVQIYGIEPINTVERSKLIPHTARRYFTIFA